MLLGAGSEPFVIRNALRYVNVSSSEQVTRQVTAVLLCNICIVERSHNELYYLLVRYRIFRTKRRSIIAIDVTELLCAKRYNRLPSGQLLRQQTL